MYPERAHLTGCGFPIPAFDRVLTVSRPLSRLCPASSMRREVPHMLQARQIHRFVRPLALGLLVLLAGRGSVEGAGSFENPIPTPNGLEDVIAFASDDVWAVGHDGTVLHWDGSAWTVLSTPPVTPTATATAPPPQRTSPAQWQRSSVTDARPAPPHGGAGPPGPSGRPPRRQYWTPPGSRPPCRNSSCRLPHRGWRLRDLKSTLPGAPPKEPRTDNLPLCAGSVRWGSGVRPCKPRLLVLGCNLECSLVSPHEFRRCAGRVSRHWGMCAPGDRTVACLHRNARSESVWRRGCLSETCRTA